MKLSQLSVENIRSFGPRRTIDFNDDFTILIGPNAGGKSNLLDIITVGTRQFFLKPWGLISDSDAAGPFVRFGSEEAFPNFGSELSKFTDATEPSVMEFHWKLYDQDIANIKTIAESFDQLKESVAYIRNGASSVEVFKSVKPEDFKAGDVMSYEIRDGTVQSLSGEKGIQFRHFLQHFNKLKHIKKENSDLTTPFVHFSAYRSIGALRMSLAGQNQWGFDLGYARTTSRQTTSLIDLATFHFGSKRRHLESTATEKGFGKTFREDPEVVQITSTLQKLGYEWDVVLREESNNTYEITLTKDSQTFDLASASSGEKEIINFILGIFALNVRNGLVVVDEPELHLHPKWQRALYGVFEELHNVTKNQFILATHSAAFVTPRTIGKLKRVARVKKQSTIVPLASTLTGNKRDMLQMINSHNNEKLFFADKVVLVEGIQDRLLFEKVIADMRKEKGPKVPATEIIEVLEVYGKGNLSKYRELLESMEVASFVIADRDYAKEIGGPEIKALFVEDLGKVAKKTLADPKSEDRASLAAEIHKAISSGDVTDVQEIWKHIIARQATFKEALTDEEKAQFAEFIKNQATDRNFVLEQGAIEAYLPEGSTSLEQTIELVSDSEFDARMKAKSKRYDELKKICTAVLDA